MSENHHESNHHGHSVAMWTAVIILLIAFGGMCLSTVLASKTLFILFVVLAIIGVIAGVALSKAGYGADKLLPPGQMPAGTGGEGGDAPEGMPSAGVH